MQDFEEVSWTLPVLEKPPRTDIRPVHGIECPCCCPSPFGLDLPFSPSPSLCPCSPCIRSISTSVHFKLFSCRLILHLTMLIFLKKKHWLQSLVPKSCKVRNRSFKRRWVYCYCMSMLAWGFRNQTIAWTFFRAMHI